MLGDSVTPLPKSCSQPLMSPVTLDPFSWTSNHGGPAGAHTTKGLVQAREERTAVSEDEPQAAKLRMTHPIRPCNFWDLRWHAPIHVYILMGSLAALTGIMDIQGHMNQCEHLLFHSLLMALCDRYQGLHFTMVWSPPQQLRVMDNTAQFKALAACCLTPHTSLNRVQSAAHSKAVAREHTFSLWAQDWEAKRRATPGPPSWAYENALLHPPDGSNHPLWMAAVATDKDPNMGQ